jgi:hypothetical protein
VTPPDTTVVFAIADSFKYIRFRVTAQPQHHDPFQLVFSAVCAVVLVLVLLERRWSIEDTRYLALDDEEKIIG